MMFNCPYCGTQLAHPKPEELPMSFKRREVYDYIVRAGARGVRKEEIVKRFFAACGSETVLRTTIHYINKTIKPVRIHTRGGIIRLTNNEQ